MSPERERSPGTPEGPAITIDQSNIFAPEGENPDQQTHLGRACRRYRIAQREDA